MFSRDIVDILDRWSAQKDRKPLVIKGARQVGKTTAVNLFSKKFKHYIYLNLELTEDQAAFKAFTDLPSLLEILFFNKNLQMSEKDQTLLFIDEIQEVPEALNILRYFYEKEPGMTVIAAGSMLETLFDKKIHFPVGRVEYKVIRPVSFPEFLEAVGEHAALEQIQKIPVASFTHAKLLKLFHEYALVGGMPAVVNNFAENHDLVLLSPIYDSLITSYIEDVEKYAANNSQLQIIRHAIQSSFVEAGKRIKYNGFGNSAYGSREMGEALRTMERALLIHLVFPYTSATLPLLPDLKKSPRLQILDTGMLNYFAGIQKEVLGTTDLNAVYQGTMIEHLVGQELLAQQHNSLSGLHFWVREKKTSTAEVDYIYPYDGQLIPIEVKSGTEGRLRSLHLYMDTAPHDMAIRFYAGNLKLTKSTTLTGKSYHLLSLPYYLASQIEKYILWLKEQAKD